MRVLIASLIFASGAALAADFGAPLPADAQPVPVAQAIAAHADYADSAHAFSGRIGQVCQNKGCWMTLVDGDAMVRVMTGHDYVLPKDAKGDAVVYGRLVLKELTEKQATHMARESGETGAALASAHSEWRIDASGVRIN
jgi:hypothetical protein